MTTQRWENRPVPWVRHTDHQYLLDALEASRHVRLEAFPNSDPMDFALNQLRDELRDARADRDRYIARCAELELRLQRVREVVR
jgi:hypothetical protein